jgi:AraC family transcriptional regulator, transcriptional activator FtrA
LIVVFRYDPDMSFETRRVAVLVQEGASAFELGIAVEVFGYDPADLGAARWYEVLVCAARPGRVRTASGFDIHAAHGPDMLAGADTVIVPGAPDVDRDPPEPVLEALRRAHACGARIASICTGAFVLAAAGLLDRRTATTHWRYARRLARRFPAVTVVPDVLYVDEGDVLTSAGLTAGIDLCLHLVRTDHGPEIANRLARRMVVAAHRDGGQSQFVERSEPAAIIDPEVAAAVEFVRDHLGEPLPLERVAAHVHLSPRQLGRRFGAALGVSPGEWILGERLEAGRALLEHGSDPIEAIARRVGLPNVSGFRRHFREVYGAPPAKYRQGYRAAA